MTEKLPLPCDFCGVLTLGYSPKRPDDWRVCSKDECTDVLMDAIEQGRAAPRRVKA